MIYHLTPIRMAIIKNSTNNPGEGMEQRECLYTVGGNVQPLWKILKKKYGDPLKSKNRVTI